MGRSDPEVTRAIARVRLDRRQPKATLSLSGFHPERLKRWGRGERICCSGNSAGSSPVVAKKVNVPLQQKESRPVFGQKRTASYPRTERGEGAWPGSPSERLSLTLKPELRPPAVALEGLGLFSAGRGRSGELTAGSSKFPRQGRPQPGFSRGASRAWAGSAAAAAYPKRRK